MSNKLCILLIATILLAACLPQQDGAGTPAVTPTATPAAASVSPGETMQPTTAIPQGEDLCGGTNGNGQIVSVGKDEFTMERNDDSGNQVVHLSGQATIRTSAGPASLSDLKPGYRVTLVGGPNPDGSFTADTVVVCNGVVP
jgi:hypothetical protein